MSNVLKYSWISVGDDTRVLDSNERVQEKLQQETERRARLAQIEQESFDSDEFFEGLPAENIDALLDEDSESAVIKSTNRGELEEINAAIEDARAELENIKAEAAETVENAEAEAQRIKEEAFESGRSEGYEAGYREGMESVEALKNETEEYRQQLENDYYAQIESLEPQFVDALTDIYEHIFKIDLDSYRSIVANLLIDAIVGSGTTGNVIVHIAKDDYPHIMEMKAGLLSETGMPPERIEFIMDATLASTECLIETESGVYDCSLETELNELKRKLMILAYRRD